MEVWSESDSFGICSNQNFQSRLFASDLTTIASFWCRFWWWSWPWLLYSDADYIQYLTHKFLFLLRQWNHRRTFSHLYKYICIKGSFAVLRCFSWYHLPTPVEVRANENLTEFDGGRCWRSSVSHLKLMSNCQGPNAAIWESKTVGHQQLCNVML